MEHKLNYFKIIQQISNTNFIVLNTEELMSKEFKIIATSAILTASFSTANASTQISVKDLNKFGLDSALIATAFQDQLQINLNPNELIKVSYDNEGKDIKFETLDHYSVFISAPTMSLGAGNKGDVLE